MATHKSIGDLATEPDEHQFRKDMRAIIKGQGATVARLGLARGGDDEAVLAQGQLDVVEEARVWNIPHG